MRNVIIGVSVLFLALVFCAVGWAAATYWGTMVPATAAAPLPNPTLRRTRVCRSAPSRAGSTIGRRTLGVPLGPSVPGQLCNFQP